MKKYIHRYSALIKKRGEIPKNISVSSVYTAVEEKAYTYKTIPTVISNLKDRRTASGIKHPMNEILDNVYSAQLQIYRPKRRPCLNSTIVRELKP
jgi:hypothetical protein